MVSISQENQRVGRTAGDVETAVDAIGGELSLSETFELGWRTGYNEAVNSAAQWQPASTAPKDGTPFLAWCPIVVGLGDTDATPDAEMRVVWWEARGSFTSDRDLGNEDFSHWQPLPTIPPWEGDRVAVHERT